MSRFDSKNLWSSVFSRLFEPSLGVFVCFGRGGDFFFVAIHDEVSLFTDELHPIEWISNTCVDV